MSDLTYAPTSQLPRWSCRRFHPGGHHDIRRTAKNRGALPRRRRRPPGVCPFRACEGVGNVRNRSASQPGQHLAVKRIAIGQRIARRSAFTPRSADELLGEAGVSRRRLSRYLSGHCRHISFLPDEFQSRWLTRSRLQQIAQRDAAEKLAADTVGDAVHDLRAIRGGIDVDAERSLAERRDWNSS